MSRRAFITAAGILAAAVIALIGIGRSEKTAWDAEFPMANAGISWEQTFHPGPWGGAE